MRILELLQPRARRFSNFAERAIETSQSIRIKMKEGYPLVLAIESTLTERRGWDSKVTFRIASNGIGLACPKCGAYTEEARDIILLSGEGGAFERAGSVSFGGPNAASFAQGRCPNCGGNEVDATFGPEAIGRYGPHARQGPSELPIITPELLHENFVEYNEAVSQGPGAEKMRETVSYWNGRDYDTVFRLLGEAIALGLNATDKAYAHCLLGQIYIRRRELALAVTELVECLRCPERGHADAWQSAQRLYYIYNEIHRNREAKLLRLFAERVNRSLSWRHTIEHEAEVRNLARFWKAGI